MSQVFPQRSSAQSLMSQVLGNTTHSQGPTESVTEAFLCPCSRCVWKVKYWPGNRSVIKSKPKIQTRVAPMPSPGSQPSTFHPGGGSQAQRCGGPAHTFLVRSRQGLALRTQPSGPQGGSGRCPPQCSPTSQGLRSKLSQTWCHSASSPMRDCQTGSCPPLPGL